MSEVIKDSAIKLFGRTISLPRNKEVSSTVKYGSSSEPAPHEDCSDHCLPSSSSSPREVNSTREHDNKEPIPSKEELTSAQDDEASHQTTEELKSPTSSPSTEKETFSIKSSKIKDQIDTTTTTTQDKAPKKPDKILACPRCHSMDTKFCYYNNYNVNQPRHFCKNCQRYWTAGGTMRNVPVGAGRRKNKNSSSSSSSSASYYRQMMVPETLQTPLNGSSHTAVLTFGSDNSPLCDSMASVLSLAEKTQHCVKQNSNDNTNYDDNSIGASEKRDIHNNATSEEESVDNKTKNSYQGFTPELCFQGSSYLWNNPMSAPNAIYQPSYHHPVSFYPTPPFWSCMPLPSWSVDNYQSAPSPGPNSPTLGKHSRDGDVIFQTNSHKEKPGSENNNIEKNSTSSVLLIPKTLRIDDPTEAAKSSIWSTLGIKNEKGNGGLFKAFASKGGGSGEKNHVVVEASPVLKANPAALSRSIIFHERT